MEKRDALKSMPVGTGGPTILLVEDRPSLVRLLAVSFEYLGMTLHPVFDSGERLISALRNDTFPDVDLFIIDIKLPEIDGVELARRLRAAGETRPIALTSAWAPPDRSVLAELDAIYLSKPFHLPQMARELRHLVTAGREVDGYQPAMSA